MKKILSATYNFEEVITNIEPNEAYRMGQFDIICDSVGVIEITNVITGNKMGFTKDSKCIKIK